MSRLRQREPGPPRTVRLLLGMAAGLGGGLVVGSLMAYQGMFGTADGLPTGWAFFLAHAVVLGALLGIVVGDRGHALAATFASGLLIGLLNWMLWQLTLRPILGGQVPTWTIATGDEDFRALVGDVLLGGLAGTLLAVLLTGYGRLSARPPVSSPAVASAGPPSRQGGDDPARPPRIVIVGGGFGGVGAAQRLDRIAARGLTAEVTLISDSNFLLFTPMLVGVASSSLEARHVSAPVRAAVSQATFLHGRVDAIDPYRRLLSVATRTGGTIAVPYDHLVLAVGAVPHYFDLPGIAEHGFALKTIADAIRLRDHVLGMLERADTEPDPDERRRLLTFVVTGGGFAWTELIAELFDLVHGVLHFYPGVDPVEPRFVLVHSGERILPELSAELGAYALDRLSRRGIEFRLGTRLAEATDRAVRLGDGDVIPTRTLAWTAGNRPHPLVTGLPAAHGRGGALVVDPCLRVPGLDGVWAVGDCAQIPDPDRDGLPYPPTAQHALREGRAVADNIAAVLAGRRPAEFRFGGLGVLVALGHRTAVAEIGGRRISGLFAWLLWRSIYLAKLPGFEKRLRVLADWSLDLAFPRDIALTAGPPRAPAVPPGPSLRPDDANPAIARRTEADRD